MPFRPHPKSSLTGVTILEVMASCAVILMGLAAIFGMNAQSLQILRRSQQTATATQIIQERVETLRKLPWPNVSRSQAAVAWWKNPTSSAGDLVDANPVETLTVRPATPPSVTSRRSESFQIERRDGQSRITVNGDLSGERLLLVELSIQWREQQKMQERKVRTIVGRSGLTRSGIFGSAFGRVGTTDLGVGAP